jgi:seryl-tRNA synthetase
LALQVEPELRAVAEVAAKPYCGIGGDCAAAVENVSNAARRHAEIKREPICAEGARIQLSLEQTSRHILEQTCRNGDDLAAIKTRLDRVEEKVDGLDRKVDLLDRTVKDLARSLPVIVAETMREVQREHDGK